MIPQGLQKPLQLPQVAMLQLRQWPVVMRRAQLLVYLLPALLTLPEWDVAICAQFAIARTGVPQQGCINSTPVTITAGTDWDLIHSDSDGVSLDAPPSGFDFIAGLETDDIGSTSLFPDFPGVPEAELMVHEVSKLVGAMNEDGFPVCGRMLSVNFIPYSQMIRDHDLCERCRQCRHSFGNDLFGAWTLAAFETCNGGKLWRTRVSSGCPNSFA